MKCCSSCGVNYNPYGQRNSLCRTCKQKYDRDYHAKRSDDLKKRKQELQRLRIIEKRQFMFDYLKNHPCEICGESDPVVLEFDHLDQTNKTKAVSVMISNSLKKIQEEISKCRVLCCNCHRRHTAQQLGWYESIKK